MHNRPELNARLLERAMMRKGWGITDVAEACGLCWMTVSRVMSGATKKPASVKKVADAVDVTMDELMGADA